MRGRLGNAERLTHVEDFAHQFDGHREYLMVKTEGHELAELPVPIHGETSSVPDEVLVPRIFVGCREVEADTTGDVPVWLGRVAMRPCRRFGRGPRRYLRVMHHDSRLAPCSRWGHGDWHVRHSGGCRLRIDTEVRNA